MTKKKIFSQGGIFCGFLLLLTIAYWPAISMRYAYHDSLAFFLDTDTRFLPPGIAFSFVSGRYLGAVILTVAGRLVDQAQDLWVLRVLCVFQLSLCGLLLFNFLRKNFLRPLDSFFIAGILLTLPPFQIVVCQESMFFYPISILTAIASFLFCFDAIDKKVFSGGFLKAEALAVFFLILSLCTYQSGAMFFWALASAVVLFSREILISGFKKKFLTITAVGFSAMVIYRFLLETTKGLYLHLNPERNYDPYHLTVVNVADKIKWFFTGPTVKILNFWNIFPKKEYAIMFAVFVLGGMLLALARHRRGGNFVRKIKEGTIKCLFLIPLLFLTSLPNILFPQNLSFYRCYMALAAFFIFVFAWGLLTYADLLGSTKKIFRAGILFLLLCFGVVAAYQTVLCYRAKPSALELKFLEDIIRDNDLNNFSRIYFIQPDQSALYTMDDEYGNLTTSFPNDMIGFFSCGIRSRMKDRYEIYHIGYSPISGNTIYLFKKKDGRLPEAAYRTVLDFGPQAKTPADFPEPTLVVDMNQVVDQIIHQPPCIGNAGRKKENTIY